MIFPRLHLTIERWKWNADYGIYVSNLGNFKTREKKNIVCKVSTGGYLVVPNPINNYALAHRVVMMTWCPVADQDNLTVDHLNHNKRDNRVKNLEWVNADTNRERGERDYVEETPKKKIKDIKLVRAVPIERSKQTRRFGSAEAAASWLMGDQGMLDTTVESIAARIKVAIKRENTYCGYRWYGE